MHAYESISLYCELTFLFNRQFRECLGNDLATLLDPSCDNNNIEEGTLGEDDATDDRLVAKKFDRQKSAKKLLQPPPPGSRSITSFFKA